MAKARHIGKIVVTHEETFFDSGMIRPDSSYLVTGGAGGIGLLIARWLLDRGAGRVLLTGRRKTEQLPEQAREWIGRYDPSLSYLELDVTDIFALDRLNSALDHDFPLKGIIHAAGVLDDDMLINQDAFRLRQVASPKVAGVWNLHQFSASFELDFFLLFSSIAPLLGSHGQGTYAAANSYLDGFAAFRRSKGLPATSINWGPWQEAGMATRSRTVAIHWSRIGLGLLSTDQAIFALERAISSRKSQVVVMTADWQRLGETLAGDNRLPILSRLVGNRAKSTGPSERWKALIATLDETPIPQRRELLLEFMSAEARDVLALSPNFPIDPHLPFNEFGFDSLMAVEFANRLANESGVHLPATTLFDHSTMASLAEYVLGEKLGLLPKPQPVDPSPNPRFESIESMTARMIEEIVGSTDDSTSPESSQNHLTDPPDN